MFRSRRARSRGGRGSGPGIAIAGAGYIAVVHALAARAAGIPIRAIASAGGSSARHLAGGLDVRRCRPEELPAGAEVLVVATPPDSHVALALQGLAAGATVLVEKPLATTLADADRLVAAADALQGGRHLLVGENLLHAPVVVAALEHRDQVGPLSHLSVRTVQPAPDWGHFLQPLTVGGVLYDLGPHAVALALALAGSEPVSVSAELVSDRGDGADDQALVRLRHASGLVTTITVSWRGEQASWDAQAASDSGVLRLELLPEALLEVDGVEVPVPSTREVPDPRIEHLGYVDQLLDVVAPVPVGQTAAEARHVLEVIVAAYASAGADGAEVPLPFRGDRSATPMELWRG